MKLTSSKQKFNGVPDEYGTRRWYNERGWIHRDGDQPAVIQSNGTQKWYWNGVLHREGDQPAVIEADGTQHWFQNGKLHRDGNQPAVISKSGSRKKWFYEDFLYAEYFKDTYLVLGNPVPELEFEARLNDAVVLRKIKQRVL